MNDLSIIIVNYNSGSILETLVDYLLQTLTTAEVILVDNNSSDRSADFSTQLSSVRLISQAKNIGFGAAELLSRLWGKEIAYSDANGQIAALESQTLHRQYQIDTLEQRLKAGLD